MSQFARDARIAMIYEGANGIQALDLVGRKLAQDGGKHVMAFFAMVKDFLAEHKGREDLADFMDRAGRFHRFHASVWAYLSGPDVGAHGCGGARRVGQWHRRS